MSRNLITCAVNPSTAVIVDDNRSFLQNIILQLDKNVVSKTFLNPEEALKYITEKKGINVYSNILSIDAKSDNYSYSSSHLPMQFDVSKLYQYVYNKDRFSEISVVVIDYDMPQMTGAEFCRQLRSLLDLPIKIIMLTGEADASTAVDLFNEGLIDKFILKGRPDLEEILNNAILDMQKNYYRDLSAPIVKAVSAEQDTALGDPAFSEVFKIACKETSASSYYLIDSSGSFLLLDDDNTPHWLIIKTLSELNEIADQLEDAGLSNKLISSLKQGDAMLYYYNPDDYFNAAESSLKKHLFETKKLTGSKEYRYFLTQKLPDFPFDTAKVLSFNDFLHDH